MQNFQKKQQLRNTIYNLSEVIISGGFRGGGQGG